MGVSFQTEFMIGYTTNWKIGMYIKNHDWDSQPALETLANAYRANSD